MADQPPLSAELRTRTASHHARIEAMLGLPGAIKTRAEYIGWLDRFLGLYQPLEALLAPFPEWHALGLTSPPRSHAACLAEDLAALGAAPSLVRQPSSAPLPDLPTFAHAFGALYVLEGATLGGRLILRDLQGRLGTSITGATRFFGGRGDAVGPMWQSFRMALDQFGREQPERRLDVVAGAERTFDAMLVWFAPFRDAAPNDHRDPIEQVVPRQV